jgi:hypothetical protein
MEDFCGWLSKSDMNLFYAVMGLGLSFYAWLVFA